MARSGRRLVGLFGVAAAACGEPASSPAHFLVDVQPGGVTRYTTGVGDQAAIQCSFQLTARVTAAREISAEWTGGVARFYAGVDRSVVLDSVVLSKADMQSAWTSLILDQARPTLSDWSVSARLPFSLEMQFRYRVEGTNTDRTTDRIRVDCGPNVPPGGLPPPAVQVDPQSTGIPHQAEVGPASFRIPVSATAAAGVWQVGVVVSGAVNETHRMNGELKPSLRTQFTVDVPAAAALGEEIRLELYVVDGLLREHRVPIPTRPVVVDRTPPQVRTFRLDRHEHDGIGVRAWYDDSDSLHVRIEATDVRGLRNLRWEGAGVADSVDLDPYREFYWVKIPIRSGWGRAPELRFEISDRSGNRTLIPVAPGDVRIVPRADRPVHRIPLPGTTRDFAPDPVHRRIYVATGERLEVYSLPSLASLAPIGGVDSVVSVDVDETGDTLYVAAGQRRLVRVARTDPTHRVEIPLDPAVTRVTHVRVMTARRLLVAWERAGVPEIVEFSRNGGTPAHRIFAGVSREDWFQRTEDRSRAILVSGGCGTLMNRNGTEIGCVGLPHPGVPVGWDRSGETIVQGSRLLNALLQPLRSIGASGLAPAVTALSADGTQGWMRDRRGWFRVRLSDDEPLERVIAGAFSGPAWVVGGESLVIASPGGGLEVVDLR